MPVEKDFKEKYLNLLNGDGILSNNTISQYHGDARSNALARLASEASNGIARSFSNSSKRPDDVEMHMLMLDVIEHRAKEIIGHSTAISSSLSTSKNSSLSDSSSHGACRNSLPQKRLPSLTPNYNENIFISVILFPIRLPLVIAKVVFQITASIFLFFAKLCRAVVSTTIGLPLAIFLLCVCLFILVPLRIALWIVTFGKTVFMEYELFDWPSGVWFWVLNSWDLS